MKGCLPSSRPEGERGKAALLAEISGEREALLQACWAHQLWRAGELRTAEGLPLQVLFPGWLNRSAGPDFTEARLVIGGDERFGDVEVHTAEEGWEGHAHHTNTAYGRVILHIVLHRSGVGRAQDPASRPIPVFHAAPFLTEQVLAAMRDPEEMLRRYENLPGRCGLRAALRGEEALSAVIAHAAEVRARQKADRLPPPGEGADEEELLFQLIFRTLGYQPQAQAFLALAQRFPLSALGPLLERPLPEARDGVLARWFGALGLLEAGEATSGEAQWDEEYRRWREMWRALGLVPQAQGLSRRRGRPWNAPERRLVGFFHHLYRASRQGWLKAWLGLLVELDGLRHATRFRRAAVEALERLFAAPEEESWRRRISFRQGAPAGAARLIGSDRIIVVMANAVIPFFLAYARRRGDAELEKLLYRLFIVLPPEAPNHKTRFMEKRLMVASRLPASLRTQQGLLQIHQDFCTSFYEGCDSCRFPDLIVAPGGR